MNSLFLGIIAALAWGVHDICVRYVSQRISVFSALLTVLVTGAMFQFIATVYLGGTIIVTSHGVMLAVTSGFFFTIASIGLYKAFEIGPVRLVAPIIAAYPIVSVGWAAISGNPVSALQWLAIFAVIAGVSLVAALTKSSENPEQYDKRKRAILWALFSGLAFAATFIFGQAASRIAPGLPMILLIRLSAIAVLIVIMFAVKAPFFPGRSQLPLLTFMGLLDAFAVACVLHAGGLPNPEFAAVAASMFGMITILLAWAILKEKMTLAQWGGVILAFAGIGYLAT